MIIPQKALFCLNTKITLNKWKATAKWKATVKKKEFFFFNLPAMCRCYREKKGKEKGPALQVIICNRLHKACFFCVNLARNPLKIITHFMFCPRCFGFGSVWLLRKFGKKRNKLGVSFSIFECRETQKRK